MSISDKYCHSCNQWLPPARFKLLKSHRAQPCAICDDKIKAKNAAEAERKHKCEYEENKNKPKAAQNEVSSKAKAHKKSCDAFEKHNIQRQADDDLGL